MDSERISANGHIRVIQMDDEKDPDAKEFEELVEREE